MLRYIGILDELKVDIIRNIKKGAPCPRKIILIDHKLVLIIH